MKHFKEDCNVFVMDCTSHFFIPHQIGQRVKQAGNQNKNNQSPFKNSNEKTCILTKHNNKTIEWENVKYKPINHNAYVLFEKKRTTDKKVNRLVEDLLPKINCSNRSFEQNSLLLYKTLLHPSMHEITKSVVTEISNSGTWDSMNKKDTTMITTHQSEEERNFACKVVGNFKGVVDQLKGKKGRFSNLAEQFIRTVFTAFFSCNILKEFSDKVIQKSIGLSARTIQK